MSSTRPTEEPGGFIPTGLLSPSPSVVSTDPSILPHPRSTALKPGGSKETTFRILVEGKLGNVSAKFQRRFQNDDAEATGSISSNPGYGNATELIKDLDPIIDAIWVSGTPSLQIPFFFNIANALLEYLEPFPFVAEPTLKIFQKLDHAFASLLNGQDIQSGEILPGFESGRKVSTTEKVRLRGLVERTRVYLIELPGRRTRDEASETESTSWTETETETEMDDSDMDDMDIDTSTGIRRGEIDLDIARVYQKTLAELSDSLVS